MTKLIYGGCVATYPLQISLKLFNLIQKLYAAISPTLFVNCDAMDIYIPSKIVTEKTGDKAWFDDHCRRAASEKRRLFNTVKKNDAQENMKIQRSQDNYNKHAKKTP